MHTIPLQPNYQRPASFRTEESMINRFLFWTNQEQENQIAWVGISITIMTAVFFPLTMATILFHGAGFQLIIGAMISLILVVIPNLAALPTKYSIPAFFAGILIDIVLIILSFIL